MASYNLGAARRQSPGLGTVDAAKWRHAAATRGPGKGRKRPGQRQLQNMCFCETNRIGFIVKTGVKILKGNWMWSERVKSSIRFVWNGNVSKHPLPSLSVQAMKSLILVFCLLLGLAV